MSQHQHDSGDQGSVSSYQPPKLSPSEIPYILGGIMLGLLVAALDGTIVSTVMPTIIRDLHGAEFYVWPFTSYMLTSTISIILFGKISDLYGRKKIFLLGIGVFLAGSILCGFSPDMLSLIVSRAIQGVGGGIIITLSFIMVAILFPVWERGKYIGILVSVFGISSVAGPLLGGLITDIAGWNWVFFINIPIGILAILLVTKKYPEVRFRTRVPRLDLAGMVTFVCLMIPLFLALSCAGVVYTWTSPEILGLAGLAVVLIPVFLWIEKRASDPLIPLHFYKNTVFQISVIVSFLTMGLMYACIIYLPLFMQDVQKSTASESGMVITPMVVSMIIASYIAGQLVSRMRRYRILAILSVTMILIGFLVMTGITPAYPLWLIVSGTIFLGAGIGMLHPIFTIAAQNEFPIRDMGTITSSLQFFRNMGGTVLTPVYGYLMAITLQSSGRLNQTDFSLVPPDSLVYAIHHVFLLCIVISCIALIITLVLKDIRIASREKPEDG